MADETDFIKKSVSLHGHRTSVSLEKAFWDVLEDSAKTQGISLAQLIKNVDSARKGNLASALRVYALSLSINRPIHFLTSD
jgi:predicted DNA-binding ribbon-helix-helix protein